MPSNHLILCHPLSPSIFPSIRVFSNESDICIRWPKHWSFSISPYNEYSRLIFFRIDWFDHLAVQGTLKSLLQHSSKASVPWYTAFCMVELTSIHDYYKICVCVCVCVHACMCPCAHALNCITFQPYELEPTSLPCPWDFPGKNTEMGSCALLQGGLPDKGMEPMSHVSCVGNQVLYH